MGWGKLGQRSGHVMKTTTVCYALFPSQMLRSEFYLFNYYSIRHFYYFVNILCRFKCLNYYYHVLFHLP